MKKSLKVMYIAILAAAAVVVLFTPSASIFNKVAVVGVSVVGILALLGTKTVD